LSSRPATARYEDVKAMPSDGALDPGQNAEPRSPLSKDRVFRAGISLADIGGIDALSMRKLAQELGVEAMSLYYHVAGKDEILNGIVDIAVGEIELPPDDAGWKAALRASAISAHEVLRRHPWACNLLMSGDIGPARRRYMESVLGRLRQSGLSAQMTDHAYHALDSHIIGFTLWEAGYSAGMAQVPEFGPTFLRELGLEDYPYLSEHAAQHFAPPSEDDVSDFEFGLELILDGLERILETP
jgi:AcrR family transcriptional regulator